MCLPVLLCWLVGAPNRSLFFVWMVGDKTNGGDFKESVPSGLVIKKSACGDKGEHLSSGLEMK